MACLSKIHFTTDGFTMVWLILIVINLLLFITVSLTTENFVNNCSGGGTRAVRKSIL